MFLQRKGETLVQKLDQSGQLDNPFREEGLRFRALRIPRQESTPISASTTPLNLLIFSLLKPTMTPEAMLFSLARGMPISAMVTPR